MMIILHFFSCGSRVPSWEGSSTAASWSTGFHLSTYKNRLFFQHVDSFQMRGQLTFLKQFIFQSIFQWNIELQTKYHIDKWFTKTISVSMIHTSPVLEIDIPVFSHENLTLITLCFKRKFPQLWKPNDGFWCWFVLVKIIWWDEINVVVRGRFCSLHKVWQKKNSRVSFCCLHRAKRK